jgi:hypothetical protein
MHQDVRRVLGQYPEALLADPQAAQDSRAVLQIGGDRQSGEHGGLQEELKELQLLAQSSAHEQHWATTADGRDTADQRQQDDSDRRAFAPDPERRQDHRQDRQEQQGQRRLREDQQGGG